MKHPLTPAQLPHWVSWRRYPDRLLESALVRIEWSTGIDVEIFNKAFNHIVALDDSMRLVFGETNGEAWQTVLVPDALSETLEIRDFTGDVDPIGSANWFLDEVQKRPFDLTHRNFTAALAKVSEERFLFQVNAHPIASDYTTKSLLITRLEKTYRQLLEIGKATGRNTPSFLEYIERIPQNWRRASISGSEGARLTAILPHETGALNLPREFIQRSEHLGPLRAARVRQMAGVKPHVPDRKSAEPIQDVFVAVTMVLYARLSGERQATVGVVSHGRYGKEARRIMGQFVRTVPITIELEEDWCWDQLLASVRQRRKAAMGASRKGEQIVAPSMPATVNFIPDPLPDFLGTESRKVFGAIVPAAVGSDFNLRIETPDEPGDFKLVMRLCREVNSVLHGLDLFELWGRVLDGLAAGKRIEDIALGGPKELRAAKTAAASAYAVPAPEYRTLVSAFLAQCEAKPNCIAIEDGRRQVTFFELEEQSRRIAGALLARGVRGGELVALHLPRSVELLAAILGILRAGAGFYCIDTNLPAERIKDTVAETDPPLVLHASGILPSSVGGVPTVGVGELLFEGRDTPSEALPEIDPWSPMYVMFTSGSTGKPKGILIPHESFMRYQYWIISELKRGSGEPLDWALSTSLAFESAYRCFLALQTGNTIYCYDKSDGVTGMSAILALKDDKCGGISLTPSQLRLVVAKGLKAHRLRNLVLIGEPLPTELAKAAVSTFPNAKIWNFYGPTETTMAVTGHLFDLKHDTGATVPIGRSSNDAVCYVLDNMLRPVPRGIPGELVIGGKRLSLGYLNRPELTASSFIEDPFFPGGTAYRSGDLCYVDDHGNLVHLGRKDTQVKINGLRVEIADIETALIRHPFVESCAVIAVKEEETAPFKLVAFYTSSAEIEASELHDTAGQVLARALLPKAYLRVNEIPLTQSGKSDRRALHALLPEKLFLGAPGVGEPPRNDVEKALALIWNRILKVEPIARDDDFFELGGDSLSFLNMVLTIELEWGIEISTSQLGASSTLREIARLIPADGAGAEPILKSVRHHGSRILKKIHRTKSRALSVFSLNETKTVNGALDSDAKFDEVARRIKLAAGDWPGKQLGQRLPIFGQNLDGDRPELIWCFNGGHEPLALGKRLAPHRPLYALRSMQAVVKIGKARDAHLQKLASTYVDEMFSLLPDRPYLLGGNCQSGRLVTALAQEVLSRGGAVAGLFLLDFAPQEPLPIPVSLFFGRDAVGYNPFLSTSQPQRQWENLFQNVTWDIVPGRHGQYFRSGRVEAFSAALENRLSNALAVQEKASELSSVQRSRRAKQISVPH